MRWWLLRESRKMRRGSRRADESPRLGLHDENSRSAATAQRRALRPKYLLPARGRDE